MSEENVVRLCAPTLAGIKTGSLFSCPCDSPEELRQEVRELLAQMHDLYSRGHTPKVKPTKSCNACSLKELCLPKLMRNRPVADYLRRGMEES